MAYTIADYIIQRLKEQGVDVLFGVPSVYCAQLFAAAEAAAGFKAIVTSSDLEAGYAADGYARVRRLAAVAVCYGPGTLSLVNAIAGAYIERSPIVVINGGPSRKNIEEQADSGVLFSHSMGQPHTDLDVFRSVTAFCERVEDPASVPAKVDQAIRVARTRQHPVYLEIPQGVLGAACAAPTAPIDLTIPAGAAPAVADRILLALAAAKAPLLIVGVEVQRYGMAARVLSIVNKLKIRWATTLLERTTLSEQHALFQGVFNGEKAPAVLKSALRGADLIVSLGAVFGSGHASIMIPQKDKTIRIWDGKAHISGTAPQDVGFPALVQELDQKALNPCAEVREDAVAAGGAELGEAAWDGERGARVAPAESEPKAGGHIDSARAGMSYANLFQVVEAGITLDPGYILVADTFLGIYAAARVSIAGQDGFMASAIWASIGHSVAAGTGAAAAKRKRPFIVCGDGGFQMTAQSLSTMARYGLNAITLIVDNGLYGYEQYLLDPTFYSNPGVKPLSYSVIGQWQYADVARAMGIGHVAKVATAAELSAAISAAKAYDGPTVIQALVDPRSLPPGL